MTTTAAILDERLCKAIGDWLEFDVTTAFAATTTLVSTTLNQYDDGRPDRFNGYYVYVTENANIGASRKIYDYSSGSTFCSVRGAFVAEAATTVYATCRISRHGYPAHMRALNDAIRELPDSLFREIDDSTLVTGNHLPNGHFEYVDTTDEPLLYEVSGSGATLATDATNYFGSGLRSAKLTRSGTDCYMYISDVEHQPLLDLMDKTVNFRSWAYASTTSQARLTIHTNDAAGSTQTENSDYHSGGGTWELLEIENFKINPDITDIEFRFNNVTTDSSVYYDNARVTGTNIHEYLLPETLQDGDIQQVYVQHGGYSDYPCDDLKARDWERIHDYDVTNNGTYSYLWLHHSYSTDRKIRLIGTSPLTELTTSGSASFSSTTEIDGSEVDLLVSYAAYCLYRNEEGAPSSEDNSRYTRNQRRYLDEFYRLLPSHRMVKPSGTMKLPAY